MTQRDEDNLDRFGQAYNNIGRAVRNLCEIRGNGTSAARKIEDKLEVLSREIQVEMEKLRNS